jgi:hypothetical protein
MIKNLSLNEKSLKYLNGFLEIQKIHKKKIFYPRRKSISRILMYFFKTKIDLKKKKAYGSSTIPLFFNFNFQSLIIVIILLYDYFFYKKKVNHNGNFPYFWQDFSYTLYNYFLNKNLKVFVGNIHDLKDFPELMISILQKNGKFHGVQHGFGYNFVKNNLYHNFEINLSDNFYYWPYGKKNFFLPRRYSFLNKYFGKIFYFFVGNKVNFILSPCYSDYKRNQMGGLHVGLKKKSFDRMLENLKNKVYVFPHPAKNKRYNIGHIKKKYILSKPHFLCSDKAINILDDISHTIFYYFLLFDIPFLIISERHYLKLKLTKQMKNIIKVLRNLNLLFYVDEIDNFDLFLNNIKPYQLKKRIIRFKKITKFSNKLLKL